MRRGGSLAVAGLLAAMAPGAAAQSTMSAASADVAPAVPGSGGVTDGARQEAEPLETVTLEEAIRRATRFDPDYVAALGRIHNAGWARRAAISRFVIPSIEATGSYTEFSSEFFNVGTGELTTRIVQSQLQGNLNLFRGGAKFFELGRTGADIAASVANEVRELYQTALDTETAYYDVLAGQELLAVARERERRAEEQLAVARARVVSGAAVQTDSLQLLLELTRARVDWLRQGAELRVQRYELGRRVGADGPVDAAPLENAAAAAAPLPIGQDEAIAEALERGPEYRTVRAEQKSAEAFLREQRAAFLPRLDLFGQLSTFDDRVFPDATVRSSVGLSVTVPLWNGGVREVQVSEARAARDEARARRADVERSVRRDIVQAYAQYETARASLELEERAVLVARENLRVQETRYRRGATTILDLLTAQVDLADAEAGLVQARYATRLALAGLEAILGRRLFPDRVQP